MKSCNLIVQCAKEHGFFARSQENIGLEGIIQTINKQIPLIAVIRYTKIRGVSHAVVVVGYETKPNTLLINDPDEKRQCKISYSEFSDLWRIRRKKDGTNQYGIIIHD